MNIKRYNLGMNYNLEEPTMKEFDRGKWIKYTDAEKLIKALENLIAGAKKEDNFSYHCRYCEWQEYENVLEHNHNCPIRKAMELLDE